MKTFFSEIDWQMNEYEVQVRVGAFPTAAAADAFGEVPEALEVADGVLRLLDDEGRVLAEIGDQHITVLRQKDEAWWEKVCVTDDDYCEVAIPIADFHKFPALLDLEGISCGHGEGAGARLANVVSDEKAEPSIAFAPLEAMALLGFWDRGELVSQTAATEAAHLRLAGEIWLATDADDVPAARAAITEIVRLIDAGEVRLVAAGEIAGCVRKTIERARAAMAGAPMNVAA